MVFTVPMGGSQKWPQVARSVEGYISVRQSRDMTRVSSRAATVFITSLLVCGYAQAAGLHVSGAPDELTVEATGVPLARLLDEVTSKAGIALHYDGRRPRDQVTLSVRNQSGTEIVLSLLQRLGCNYAARWERTGLRIDVLLVSAPTPVREPPAPAYRVAETTTNEEAEMAAELKAIAEVELGVSNAADEDSAAQPAPPVGLFQTPPPARDQEAPSTTEVP